MNKKSIVQLIVSIILFGLTSYVMYGFFNKDEGGDDSAQAGDGTSVVKELDIDSLLNRDFQTEQIDIFERESFKNLKDNSVEIPGTKGLKIGKENPFESSK